MKNHSPDLPPVTYKEAIKLLNGLCDGLGDAMERLGTIHYMLPEMPVSDYVFWCSLLCEPSKYKFWDSIETLLLEIESGAGIKK
jgi:hypothetical protein